MKDYNEVAESVFQRSEEIIADNRRKRKNMISVGIPILCCLLVAVICTGANWKEFVTNDPTNIAVEPTKTEDPTDEPIVINDPYVEPTDEPDIDNSQEGGDGEIEGTGGSEYEEYDHAYDRKAEGVTGDLMHYIVENLDPNFYDWLNKWDSEHKWYLGYYTSSPEKPFIVQIIETFNVPKEVFKKIYNDEAERIESMGYDPYRDHCFTPEEVDAIFSRDNFLISEVFASKYSIITSEGLACCPRYYLRATAEELSKYGITDQQVKEKIDLLLEDEIIIIQDGEILLYYGEGYTKELH